jgi:hypothetical protein
VGLIKIVLEGRCDVAYQLTESTKPVLSSVSGGQQARPKNHAISVSSVGSLRIVAADRKANFGKALMAFGDFGEKPDFEHLEFLGCHMRQMLVEGSGNVLPALC